MLSNILSLTVLVAILTFGGFIVYRLGLRNAKTMVRLLQLAGATTILSLALVMTACAAYAIRDDNRLPQELPVLNGIEDIESFDADPRVLVAARVSEENENGFWADYPAYVRIEDDTSDADVDYYLPELAMRLQDGNLVYVDESTYDRINWNEEEDQFYRYEFLKPGDNVVFYGDSYTAYVLFGEQEGEYARVSADFIFKGSYDEFVADQSDNFQRRETVAMWFGRFCLALAFVLFLSPIPHAFVIGRTSKQKH